MPSPKRGRSKGPAPRKASTAAENTLSDPNNVLELFDDGAGPSKTRIAPTDLRRASPGTRHARFGSQLEQGPTISRGKSQSPSRSALANPRETYNRQASQQLLSEAENFDLTTNSKTSYPLSTKPRKALASIKDESEVDDTVCELLHQLRAQIIAFGEEFAHTRPPKYQSAVHVLCKSRANLQLIRYIGCLAMSGPSGVASWEEILEGAALGGLVAGILGKALKEYVFSALWFGAYEEQENLLREQQAAAVDLDGFHRTRDRAVYCKRFLQQNNKYADCDPEDSLIEAQASLAIKLETLLLPLWNLSHPTHTARFPSKLQQDLHTIIADAAHLSREMRTIDDVVYYWPPTFKDDEFEPQHMEVLNLGEMIAGSPYKIRKINGRETAVLQEGQENRKTALVRVVVLPGLVAYRQGGGALAQSQLAAEREEEDAPGVPEDVRSVRRSARDSPHKLTGEEGFRTRILGKSVVLLSWGKQRLLTVEAGTSAHLDAQRDGKMAKYEEDREGAVELFDYFAKKHPGVLG